MIGGKLQKLKITENCLLELVCSPCKDMTNIVTNGVIGKVKLYSDINSSDSFSCGSYGPPPFGGRIKIFSLKKKYENSLSR